MPIGIINVLKPPGMTSHDVVSFMRRLYGLKRVGHAGTLDPGAAGVLPVFLGSATRLIEYTTDTDKSYRVELTFGYETDTGDDTGTVIHSVECITPKAEFILQVLQSFLGVTQQIPPMYSAIKIAGKKMYELARAGIVVERQSREVTIQSIVLIKVCEHSILFDVTCSKGTYIRSLCVDIGRKLGCPGVMSFLVRTRVGSFSLENAFTLEEIAANSSMVIMPPDSALQHMPAMILSNETAKAFLYGQSVRLDMLEQGLIRIYDAKDCFLGIGKKDLDSSLLVPVKILSLG